MPRQILTLSIAIVTYRSDAVRLGATIDSLAVAVRVLRQQQAAAVNVSLWLIDNGAHGDPLPHPDTFVSPGVLAAFDSVIALPASRNLGYGGGHNLVLDKTPGEFHLILNPDVELDPAALNIGITFLREHADTVCVVPHGADQTGQPVYLAKRYPSLLVLALRAFAATRLRRRFESRLQRYEMHDMCNAAVAAEVPCASGCYLLLRSAAWREAGGFSGAYFMYFEDFDLSIRLRRQGRIVYLPRMCIVHHGGRSAGKGLRHVAWFCRSALRFFSTHGWKLQ